MCRSSELAWSALFVILVIHLVASYLLFLLAGEGDLVGNPVDLLYYYIVTATTVGYGDLSPKSGLGRLIAVLFVLPGGIAIFTAVLGQLLTTIGTIWRNRMRGLGDYSERAGHIIVLGWQEGQTYQTLRLLHAERQANEPMSVLVAKDLPEIPPAITPTISEPSGLPMPTLWCGPEWPRRARSSRAAQMTTRRWLPC